MSTDQPWSPTAIERYGASGVESFRTRGAWHDDSISAWVDRWAEQQPDRRAVSDGVRELDFASLAAQSGNLAHWLRAQGIGAGSRVAIQLPNWTEFLVSYLAAARLGAVTVPIMMVLRRDEVRHILDSSGAELAITTGDFRGFDHAQMFRELLSDQALPLRALALARAEVKDDGAEETRLDDAIAQMPAADSAAAPWPEVSADASHVVIYTSGTESRSKGCLHTWNTLAFTARALAHEVFKMTVDDVMFMPSPVAHSTGIVIGLVTPLLAGSSIHLLDVWDPEVGLRRIEEYGCSITATATPFVTMALHAAKSIDADLTSMRAWLCAGAPIPASLAHEFEAVFTQARLLPLYGCTEILMATVCQLDDPIERIASSDGAPISSEVELVLVDEDEQPVPAGTRGEIRYRGPGAILGYWGEPELTAAAIDAEGWYHTGDLGRLDEQGYLRIAGRVKDIIIRGGQNLSALEIESHLLAHPAVREAAAVAYPDARLGERVCAFVVLRDDVPAPDLDELRAFFTDTRGVAVQKAPERLEVVDSLPMTASGKIQKFLLRAQVREALS